MLLSLQDWRCLFKGLSVWVFGLHLREFCIDCQLTVSSFFASLRGWPCSFKDIQASVRAVSGAARNQLGTGTPVRPHLVENFSKDGSSHPKKQPESSDFEGDPVAHLQMFPETCPEIHKVPLWSQLTPANLFTISWRTQDICDSHSFKFQWKNWHKPYILLGMEQRTAILHVEFPNVCQSMMNLQPARLTLRWSAKKKASSWKIWMEQWCGNDMIHDTMLW